MYEALGAYSNTTLSNLSNLLLAGVLQVRKHASLVILRNDYNNNNKKFRKRQLREWAFRKNLIIHCSLVYEFVKFPQTYSFFFVKVAEGTVSKSEIFCLKKPGRTWASECDDSFC